MTDKVNGPVASSTITYDTDEILRLGASIQAVLAARMNSSGQATREMLLQYIVMRALADSIGFFLTEEELAQVEPLAAEITLIFKPEPRNPE